MHVLAVIVVSTGQARWLPRSLPALLQPAGGLALDVVVVDNGPAGDTQPPVEREFPCVPVLDCEKRGVGNANNLGLAATASRHVLFLNPDTEVLTGSLAALVAELDRRPDVGLVGVRQVGEDGIVQQTMRRFASVWRTLGDALGLERLPGRPNWLGERELRLGRYDEEVEGDRTSGSFMLVCYEALSGGGLVQRAVLRLLRGDRSLPARAPRGLEGRPPADAHDLPRGNAVRVVDHMMARQNAYSRLQYARKHLTAPQQAGVRAALLLRNGLRSVPRVGDRARPAAARAAAGLVLGFGDPSFPEGA